jgi:hypothetical protein
MGRWARRWKRTLISPSAMATSLPQATRAPCSMPGCRQRDDRCATALAQAPANQRLPATIRGSRRRIMPIWLESCGRTSGRDSRVGKAPRRQARAGPTAAPRPPTTRFSRVTGRPAVTTWRSVNPAAVARIAVTNRCAIGVGVCVRRHRGSKCRSLIIEGLSERSVRLLAFIVTPSHSRMLATALVTGAARPHLIVIAGPMRQRRLGEPRSPQGEAASVPAGDDSRMRGIYPTTGRGKHPEVVMSGHRDA